MKQSETFSRQTWWIILVVGLIGLTFLLRNHTSHVFSVLPYLILLLCPLMHLFMHKGHGDHGGTSDQDHKHPTPRA